MIDLKQFCGTNDLRSYLHAPFTIGEFTYATDGNCAVRVPRQEDAASKPQQLTAEKVEVVFANFDKASFAPLRHGPLPDLPDPYETECDCYEGHEHNCPDCECVCEACNGSGTVMETKRVSTTVRGGIFNLRYVKMMLALPNVEVMTNRRGELTPLWFRFDGGVGAIMPCRCELDDHVEIEINEAA